VTESEAQEARLAEFVRFGVAPASERWRRAQQGPDPAEAMWALGVLLEAGAWICLGTEIGYFPRSKALAVLERSVGRQPKQSLVREDRHRIVGNRWTESLFSGNLDEALFVRTFQSEQEGRRLLSEFDAVLLLAWEREGDEMLQRVLRAFLLDDDVVWEREIQRTARLLAMVASGVDDSEGQQAWRACGRGEAWVVDGLVRFLVHLDAVETWAASARSGWGLADGRSLTDDEEELGDVDEDSTRPEDVGKVFVRSVGRVLRWRLERGDARVRERLESTTRLLEATTLMRALIGNEESPWPGGFRNALNETLNRWEQMSAQTVSA
jgi:hypothetical protein